MRASRRTGSASGFSLIELLCSVSLLGMIVAGVYSVADSSENIAKQTTARGRLLGKGNEALRRCVGELGCAGLATVSAGASAPTGSDSITFLTVIGSVGATPTWSTTRRLESQLADGELDNGIDDDSDGLIDERRLVLTFDAGGVDQKQVVLAQDLLPSFPGEIENGLDDNGNGVIDEGGFNVHVSAGALVLHLAMQQLDGQGGRLTETFETRIHPRN